MELGISALRRKMHDRRTTKALFSEGACNTYTCQKREEKQKREQREIGRVRYRKKGSNRWPHHH